MTGRDQPVGPWDVGAIGFTSLLRFDGTAKGQQDGERRRGERSVRIHRVHPLGFDEAPTLMRRALVRKGYAGTMRASSRTWTRVRLLDQSRLQGAASGSYPGR